MSIGPEDIERAVFKERFRGYDTNEVDRFLDQVAGSLAALRAERDQLAAEDVEPAPEPIPSEQAADELASPWDDLWQGPTGKDQVPSAASEGMDLPGGGTPEPPPRGATTAEHAGDA